MTPPDPRSSHRLRLCAALVLAASAAAADSEDLSAPAHLECTEVVAGQPVTVTLRSQDVGALAVIYYSGSSGTLVAPNPLHPVLRIGAPYFVAAAGRIDGSGRLQVSATLPPTFPPGSQLFFQGIVLHDRIRLVGARRDALRFGSEPLAITVGALPTEFTDGTSLLDPASELFSSSDVDWADFDRDGLQDVVVANGGEGERPLLMLNLGSSFVDEAVARLPFAARAPAICVEVGDVDGDGTPDLFLGKSGATAAPAPNLLLLNDGSGSFSRSTSFPAGVGQAIDAEFGDVDGDRDLDLVVANKQDPLHPSETPDGVALYRNQGGAQGGKRGEFLPDAVFGGLGSQPHFDGGDVSLGDLDNDGDLDLFIARTGSGGALNQLYVNAGDGTFTDVSATALPGIPGNAFEADFADFDGDGLLDVFVANSISSVPTGAHLLMNQGPIGPGGTPVFADASANVPATFGPASNVRLSLDIADVEQDGDPDVVIGIHMLPSGPGTFGGYTTLLLNQGGAQGGLPATFAVDTAFDPFGLFVGADVSFGDVDADGDLDLYLANSGDLFQTEFQDRLLINQH